jgi:hypothetical protein
MRHRGRFLNQDVERGSGDQFATVSANLPSTTPANASPAQAAAQSNPHRRPTTHQPPRVLSSEAFGRRPPTRLYRSTTGRHPKPFTKPVIDAMAIAPLVSTRTRPFDGVGAGRLISEAALELNERARAIDHGGSPANVHYMPTGARQSATRSWAPGRNGISLCIQTRHAARCLRGDCE